MTSSSKLLVTLTDDELRALVREAVRDEVHAREPEPEVLTLQQTAAMLHTTRQRIVRLVSERGFPGHRLAGLGWRFRRSEILRWLDAQRASTRAA